MRPRLRSVTPGSQTRQASTFPASNPYTPAIPQPSENISNLASCVSALKANVESLTGQRGEASNRAATFNDLVFYGLLTPDAINSPVGGVAQITNLRVSVVTIKQVEFAELPTGVAGMIMHIVDSTTNVWGDIIAGLGSHLVLGFYNGANWTVMAK